MDQPNDREPQPTEISREQFLSNPQEAVERSQSAPIVVRGMQGERRMVLSSPRASEYDHRGLVFEAARRKPWTALSWLEQRWVLAFDPTTRPTDWPRPRWLLPGL